MADKRGQKANRIPVHFVDDEKMRAAGGDDEPAAEEIGRESSYEGETEVKRRIDRGQEEEGGGADADDRDTAGGPPRDELPERREDQHQAAPTPQPQASAGQTAKAASDPGAQATGPVLAELIATRAELKRVQAERAELRDALARRQADFENYRKRMERDRSESYNRMVGDVVSKLLPVLDNLRRALDAEGSLQANESEEFRHFLSGVELIYKQLNTVLEGLGLAAGRRARPPFRPARPRGGRHRADGGVRTRHCHPGDRARLSPRREAAAPGDSQSSYEIVVSSQWSVVS